MKVGILTVSDRAFENAAFDQSGPALAAAVKKMGAEVASFRIVADDATAIEENLIEMADRLQLDVVLTTGGTGVAPRDVTPEATGRVIEREVPGIAESIRARSLEVTPRAMLSRGIAGLRGRCLIVNLPGSPKGALESFAVFADQLEHVVALLRDRPVDH